MKRGLYATQETLPKILLTILNVFGLLNHHQNYCLQNILRILLRICQYTTTFILLFLLMLTNLSTLKKIKLLQVEPQLTIFNYIWLL